MAEIKNFRPTVAEISLPALKNNLLKIQKLAGPSAKVMFVVKANAYGHGAVACARFAQAEGLAWGFGVSSVEEGITLRAAKIKSPILILGSLFPFESFKEAINNKLMVTISSIESAVQVSRAAASLGKKAVCHVKLETGMNRIGARRPTVIKIFEELANSKSAIIGGLYTHLSCADNDADFTRQQLSLFSETTRELERFELAGVLKHAANSAGLVNFSESRLDMVRTGLAAYGMMKGFSPVLSWKTKIVFLKTVRSGAFVSYGKSFKAKRPMKVATLPVGYGDGYLRSYSNSAGALVAGKKCPIIGNVTMDMTMIDVTDVKAAAVGSEVVLIGSQSQAAARQTEITAAELSAAGRTIPYETVTLITPRVPRFYTR